jgi:flagellar biosynthesis protein FliP
MKQTVAHATAATARSSVTISSAFRAHSSATATKIATIGATKHQKHVPTTHVLTIIENAATDLLVFTSFAGVTTSLAAQMRQTKLQQKSPNPNHPQVRAGIETTTPAFIRKPFKERTRKVQSGFVEILVNLCATVDQ